MDPKQLNPAEQTAAESDYQKKFNRTTSEVTNSGKKLKEQESSGGDAGWKTTTKAKKDASATNEKKRFRFVGRRGGKLRRGSAFTFIFALIIGGVWYTSVLAPNILLVNVKEMYTNDLADATTALEIYTQVMYFNKIGPLSGQDCNGTPDMSKQPIKCKLTTMSRSQVQSFEQQGFSFGIPIPDEVKKLIPNSDKLDICVQKVYEDNRDDGDPRNDQPESRYKVYCILPPNYKQVIENVKATGLSTFSELMNGNGNASEAITNTINQLLNPLKDAAKSPQSLLNSLLSNAPITSGPQLWLYSQLSTTSRAQVYSVFNPKSSYFNDAKFKERIKTRYNMTKDVTVTGETEAKVNSSFDNSVQKADGGLDSQSGQVNPTDGVSLSSLSSPLSLTQLKSLGNKLTNGVSADTVKSIANQLPAVADLETSGNLLATNTYSYTDLMCSWYTIGKMSSNALTRAKASTAARYALQYLKAADAIKAGTADEVSSNVLASKLAQRTVGDDYGGGSATDSLIYRSVTYGDTFPSSLGDLGSLISDPSKIVNLASDAASIVAYNLSAYENIGTLAASWLQVIPNAAALGAVTGASGMLAPPPANIGGSDRQYCLSGETTQNKTATKGDNTDDTKCTEALAAMSPLGLQAAFAGAAEVGRRTCPPLNASDDNLIQLYLGTWRGPVSNTMLPSQKIAQIAGTPYIAGWFGINTMVAAATTQQLYTSQIKGIAANYALFSGMGELLGDMAMSRGLMPSNIADMEAYLHLGEVIGVQKGEDDIAKENAKKNPFDVYNKFSFLGTIARGLTPTVNDQAPLLATLNNVFSFVSSGVGKIGQTPTASAFYHSQPSLLGSNDIAEREAGYLLRLSAAFCPLDIEAIAIGITPDIMCNVRYSMPLEDIPMALNLSGVVDYMTQTHSDAYNSQIDELNNRIGQADVEGNKEYLQTQLNAVTTAQGQPFIDKNTGKPTEGSEYQKYLQYCVNRLDPWGRSAIAINYNALSDKQKAARDANNYPDGTAATPNGGGDPNQKYVNGLPKMAVTATQSDQDWYSGKKCTRLTDQSQMLQYFRVYTMLCSVDGSMSYITDCTEPDRADGNYSNPFYLNNDVLYTSWY